VRGIAQLSPLVGTLVVLVAACGGPENVLLPECVEGPAEPLTAATVIRVLRKHGFSAQPEHKFLCAPRVVAGVTNAPPGDYSSATSERAEQEGTVFCGVEKQPFPKPFLQRDEDSKKVRWSVGNVDCAVYFVKGHKERTRQTRRLVTMRFTRSIDSAFGARRSAPPPSCLPWDSGQERSAADPR
jgi:hypothetical protein